MEHGTARMKIDPEGVTTFEDTPVPMLSMLQLHQVVWTHHTDTINEAKYPDGLADSRSWRLAPKLRARNAHTIFTKDLRCDSPSTPCYSALNFYVFRSFQFINF